MPSRRTRHRLLVACAQAVVFAAVLVGWEFVPRMKALQHKSHLFDPFFISSPSRISDRLYALATGAHHTQKMWPYLWPTLEASLIGTAIGMALGAVAGLIFSNFKIVSEVFTPFVVALNAVPRIALIPVLVLVFGITLTTSFVGSILVVFFLAFFNAYEGGRSVPPHLTQNAIVLGASPAKVMRHVRLPYVLAWTLATLPVAATFSLLVVVTTEIFTGYPGLGQFLNAATSTADATLTFSVVVILSVLGLLIVGLAELIKRRVLHWWAAG